MSLGSFTLVAGDLLPIIQATLISADGSTLPIDLTGASHGSASRDAEREPDDPGRHVHRRHRWSRPRPLASSSMPGSRATPTPLENYDAEWLLTIGGKPMTVPNASSFRIVIRPHV